MATKDKSKASAPIVRTPFVIQRERVRRGQPKMRLTKRAKNLVQRLKAQGW